MALSSEKWTTSAEADRQCRDGAPVGTEFEYTRYLDGKYLDSRSAKLTAPTRFFLFETKVVAGKQLVSGHWRYQIYMNRGYIGATEFVVA